MNVKHIFRTFSLIVLAAMLATCEKPIEGELTMLLGGPEYIPAEFYSPCWSYDGSKVYFTSNLDTTQGDGTGPFRIWSIDVESGKKETVSTDEYPYYDFDVSSCSDLGLFYSEDSGFIIYDLVDWTVKERIFLDSSWGLPKFSLESEQILYYTTRSRGPLLKYDREDSTDEVIIESGDGGTFAPGPGDSLFALGDTIHNINTDERIYLPVDPQLVKGMNWNPANPNELLIVDSDGRLAIFNIETRRKSIVDIRSTRIDLVMGARFSPDGSSIVFTGIIPADAIVESQMWLWKRKD